MREGSGLFPKPPSSIKGWFRRLWKYRQTVIQVRKGEWETPPKTEAQTEVQKR